MNNKIKNKQNITLQDFIQIVESESRAQGEADGN